MTIKPILKKTIIAITALMAAIFLATGGFLYSSAKCHRTDMAYEAYCQFNRFFRRHEYKTEVDYAKFFLLTIKKNEHPPGNWNNMLGELLSRRPEYAFYFFKVWLIESETTEAEIAAAYPAWVFKDGAKHGIELRYGCDNPLIQFSISTRENGTQYADALFPLNNCLFSTDYNGDSAINYADVLLARKAKALENKART